MFGEFTEHDLLNSLKYTDLAATAKKSVLSREQKEDPVKRIQKKSVTSDEVTLFCYMEMFN